MRRIQKLESDIKSLENDIDQKDEGIRKGRRKIEAIHKSGRKLNIFGKVGLSEEEKSINTQVNSGIDNWTKFFAKVISFPIAYVSMNLSWRLLTGITGNVFTYFVHVTSLNNENASILFVKLCLSVLVAFGIWRLVYALIMMLVRQKSVDHLASEQERWLWDLQAEKRELQNKLERLKRELVVAKSQAL